MEKIPTDLQRALAGSPRVKALWEDLTPIGRRDFTSWIESAKQPETRKRRIAIACSKLMAGERRPCCYALVPLNLHKALQGMPKAKVQWKLLTPDEKRDFIDWVNAPHEKDIRAQRVEKTCVTLAAGKRRP